MSIEEDHIDFYCMDKTTEIFLKISLLCFTEERVYDLYFISSRGGVIIFKI